MAALATCAVAAYVISRSFGASTIRICAESDDGASIADSHLAALDGSLTVHEAAIRLATALGSEEVSTFTVAPATGSDQDRYILRYRGNENSHVEVLSGPDFGLGRVALPVLESAIAHALRQTKLHADMRLTSLTLANEKLQRHLTGPGAGRRVPYSSDKTIPQLFADQAALEPKKEAVNLGDRVLTYGQLSELANGFRQSLVREGVTHGEIVPVILENSLELPIALLALMQIGAPFVMIDDKWPRSRIANALRRLKARRVVCDASVVIPIEASTSSRITIAVENIDSSRVSAERDGSHVPVTAKDLMYGLFTSGSTGEPRCALNYHRGILNRFDNMNRRFKPEESGTVLQTSKHVYDGFLWQLFWPLTRGAKVILPKPSSAPDPLLFVELIARHQVTMTDIVPSIFKLWLRIVQTKPDTVRQLDSLRRILIGGEKINPSDVAAFRQFCPQVSFTNTYGPTEASIGMIMHDVGPDESEFIPLGRPIDNTYALVVDESFRPIPPGYVGELLIGGDCLGGGYLGDEQATAMAMIANPYPSIPGPTLYRTGDLAYVLPDGKFQFAGRIDDQVSIGGARIEVLEVENVIGAFPDVADVRVIAHESRTGSTQLAAFIVAVESNDTVENLRERIVGNAAQTLPRNYMPHRICFVSEIPLMGNGKIDRKKLISMLADTLHTGPGRDSRLRDAVENILAAIWCDILKLTAVEPDDDFFNLGGDSLQALTLIVEIQHRFAVRLSLDSIYEARTLCALANLVKHRNHPRMRRTNNARTTLQLFQDSEFHLMKRTVQPRSSRSVRKILLTGATGFVGAHLAHNILAEPSSELTCLVRGQEERSCLARLASSLTMHSLWQPQFLDRISIIPCNLARPWFGLAREQFRELLRGVDAVVLNAANVHLLQGYDKLRAVNVESVREVLINCMEETDVPVHYISSLSIFSAQSHEQRLFEDAVPDTPPMSDGYAMTKWVADRLCLAASAAGAPVSVYRLGEMMAPLRTGLANESALSTHVLSTILKLGVYPEKQAYLDYTPVDMAARIVVRAVFSGLVNKVCHVCNERPIGVGQLATMLAAARGRHAVPRPISERHFLKRLRRMCRSNPFDRDLRYVSELLPDSVSQEGILSDLCTQIFRQCETHNVDDLMRNGGMAWPTINIENLTPLSHFFARKRIDSAAASQVADGPQSLSSMKLA
jgi:amino acid adenylation domain-containing protein/thioester reductase-like protein